MTVKAYGAYAGDKPLEAMEITRRPPGAHDVQIDIAFCGVCHSDLHTVRSEWPGTLYPCVPGHEIVGHVSAVGAEVTGFKVGDTVGVGCLVASSSVIRPELYSASIAICLPGRASRVNRAATSATRVDPLVMTRNCTAMMIRKMMKPIT